MTQAIQYEADYLQWLETQAAHLRAGRLAQIDREHLLEELEGMSRSERRQLHSRLIVLLMHLLKLQYQPHRQSRSWTITVITQRNDIKFLLRESPSLKATLRSVFMACYPRARQEAAEETRLPLSVFPEEAPFSLEQALDEDYWPDSLSADRVTGE